MLSNASGGVHEFFDNGDATLDYFFTASGLKNRPAHTLRSILLPARCQQVSQGVFSFIDG